VISVQDKHIESSQITLKIITVIEIPSQDLLEVRPIPLLKLIWADMEMNSQENKIYKEMCFERDNAPVFEPAETLDQLERLVI